MPILARFIAQRLLLIGLSSLAFLGINPNVDIPTREESEQRTEARKELIQETLTELGDTPHHAAIPLPTINILELPAPVITIPRTVTITPPDVIKTTPITVPQVPIKTEDSPTAPITPTPIIEPETPTEKQPVVETPTLVDTTPSNTIANTVVQISCVRRTGNKIQLTNGSGVLISSRGIVLTNTHVAQMFLLKEHGYNCTIQRENIPTYGFEAIPLYISTPWIENNFLTISHPAPSGTGEHDYALLLITKNTNPTLSLPSSFPAASLNTRSDIANIGDIITVAGYPGVQTTDFNLATQANLKTEVSKITNVFTLARTTVDVFASDATPIARRGVSGGGVFKNNELIGTIVTTSPIRNAAHQAVNALTLDYINRSIKTETGKDLPSYITGDVLERAQIFERSVAPRLTELLLRNL